MSPFVEFVVCWLLGTFAMLIAVWFRMPPPPAAPVCGRTVQGAC